MANQKKDLKTILNMKRIFLLLSIIFLQFSCQKDEKSKPDLTLKMITLSEETINLIVGGSHSFKVTLTPLNATPSTLKWKSSNDEIVEVSEGKLLAKKDGEAIVTVETEDGKVTASCKVSVALPALTGIEIDKKDVKVPVGEDVQLNVIMTPSNAKPEEMAWASSDSSVAKVSSTGLVKTLKPGKVTIKVTSKSGQLTATSELTVSAVLVQSISISGTYSIIKGTTAKIVYSVSPSNATDKTVLFSSSNASIASVDASGNVSGLAEGESTITLSSKDGNATSKIVVKITPVRVVSITLNKTALSLLPGTSESLKATVLPANAGDKSISWKSSNSAIVTVDKDGLVRSISTGQATVTSTTVDGGFTAEATVQVGNIDKLVKIAAKANTVVANMAGNTAELSVGIYNPTTSPIKITFIKIYVNGVLSKNYSVNESELSSANYVFKLGPFALGAGVLDMANLMNGWSVKFEYENGGNQYQNSVPVKKNVIGAVTFNDFFDSYSGQSKANIPVKINIRKTPTAINF